MFAIGVGHYVFENYDIHSIKFLASSSGCFAAVPLACGFDPYEWCKVRCDFLSLHPCMMFDCNHLHDSVGGLGKVHRTFSKSLTRLFVRL